MNAGVTAEIRRVLLAVAAIIAAVLLAIVAACSSATPSPATAPPLSEAAYLVWCADFAAARHSELDGSRSWQHVARVTATAQLIVEAVSERAPRIFSPITDLIKSALNQQRIAADEGLANRYSHGTRRSDGYAHVWTRIADACAAAALELAQLESR